MVGGVAGAPTWTRVFSGAGCRQDQGHSASNHSAVGYARYSALTSHDEIAVITCHTYVILTWLAVTKY